MHSAQDEGLESRLIYLFKRSQLLMEELNNRALVPLGIDSRELAVLLAIDAGEPASQQHLAERLGVDRTTMVALLDSLEQKAIVLRHPHADDRRRNVVELTDRGAKVFRDGIGASNQAELDLLASLSTEEAATLRTSLQTILASPRRPSVSNG